MGHQAILFTVFLIFTGAAVLATLALYTRQSLLVAYVLLGLILGPSVLDLVPDTVVITQIADIGIMFLLFLLGLNLHPQKLLKLGREASLVTGLSALAFGLLGLAGGRLLGLEWMESLILAAALTISSTIIGLKLLPTTVLHNQHTGEVMISILLLQDLLAILVLLAIETGQADTELGLRLALPVLSFPLVIVVAMVLERFLLRPLLQRFDRIREYVFLLAIGWCLGIAELSAVVGLSHTIGAFVAGVALASNPIATYIAESLKPLRDFFLVLFFVTLGIGLDIGAMGEVILPAIAIAVLTVLIKPRLFDGLLRLSGEPPGQAREIGVRLGQMSEFSLLIAFMAHQAALIGSQAFYLIQLATVLSFMASSYLIVLRYPTPIAISDRLRRD
ncbi:MAG: cation:proton antiporter [Chromatiales bacterium]|jgi:Kef-type K+ transport system membrane component KefB